jgi:hypothetical protein
MKMPTDFEILSRIYETKYAEFCAFSRDQRNRSSKIYVPIEIDVIARELDVDSDIVFGRLYYHLQKKHAYQQSDGVWVDFFEPRFGEDQNVINFALLSSVLAGLKEDRDRNRQSLVLSIIAITLSAITSVYKVAESVGKSQSTLPTQQVCITQPPESVGKSQSTPQTQQGYVTKPPMIPKREDKQVK